MLLMCCSWILREYANATLQLSPSRSPLRSAMTLPDILRTALAHVAFTHPSIYSLCDSPQLVHLGPLSLLEDVRLTHLQVIQADNCTVRGVVCEFAVGRE